MYVALKSKMVISSKEKKREKKWCNIQNFFSMKKILIFCRYHSSLT